MLAYNEPKMLLSSILLGQILSILDTISCFLIKLFALSNFHQFPILHCILIYTGICLFVFAKRFFSSISFSLHYKYFFKSFNFSTSAPAHAQKQAPNILVTCLFPIGIHEPKDVHSPHTQIALTESKQPSFLSDPTHKSPLPSNMPQELVLLSESMKIKNSMHNKQINAEDVQTYLPTLTVPNAKAYLVHTQVTTAQKPSSTAKFIHKKQSSYLECNEKISYMSHDKQCSSNNNKKLPFLPDTMLSQTDKYLKFQPSLCLLSPSTEPLCHCTPKLSYNSSNDLITNTEFHYDSGSCNSNTFLESSLSSAECPKFLFSQSTTSDANTYRNEKDLEKKNSNTPKSSDKSFICELKGFVNMFNPSTINDTNIQIFNQCELLKACYNTSQVSACVPEYTWHKKVIQLWESGYQLVVPGSFGFYFLLAFADVQAGTLSTMAFGYANLANSCLIDWVGLLTSFVLSTQFTKEKVTRYRILSLILGFLGSLCIFSSESALTLSPWLSPISSNVNYMHINNNISLEKPNYNNTAVIGLKSLRPMEDIERFMAITKLDEKQPVLNVKTSSYIEDVKANISGSSRKVRGDVFSVMAAVFMGIVTVMLEKLVTMQISAQEILVKTFGLAAIIASVEFIFFELKYVNALQNLSITAWFYYISSAFFMSIVYSLSPFVLQQSSSSFLNLSLLTSTGMLVVLSTLVLGDYFPPLYSVGLIVILSSLFIYYQKK